MAFWHRIFFVTAAVFVAAGVSFGKSADVSAKRMADAVELIVTVHDGLHAQSNKPLDESLLPMVVKPTPAAGVAWGEAVYPPPTIENFPALGKVSIYTGQITITLPVKAAAGAALSGVLRLQACNDSSCFPPERLPWSVGDAAATTQPATAPAAVLPPGTGPPAQVALVKPPTIFGLNLTNNAYPLAFTAAFLIGILFNAMPCVLPVVPLKIMGFYEASQHNRGKSIALGAVFSAGLIASFGVLAVLVVAMHAISWGGLFQKTWFTVTIVVVLVAMAGNMLGLFTVNLPGSIYQFSPRHDTYTGNFLFGILTAALSTPCTFGMFVSLLTWTAAQPAVIGVAVVMTVGVGMASPYLVLSAFPEVARKFPRTGPWGELVRQLLGFLVLATAVYFAQPLFERFVSDRVFYSSIFAVVAAGCAFAIFRAFQYSKNALPRVICTTLALLVLGTSLFALLRVAATPYQWIKYSDAALKQARATGRPVLIDFTASWCGNCHYVEGIVLNNPRVVADLHRQQVIMIKADVTDDNAPAHPLLEHFTATGAIPLTVVYRDSQSEAVRLDGIYSANDLRNVFGG